MIASSCTMGTWQRRSTDTESQSHTSWAGEGWHSRSWKGKQTIKDMACLRSLSLLFFLPQSFLLIIIYTHYCGLLVLSSWCLPVRTTSIWFPKSKGRSPRIIVYKNKNMFKVEWQRNGRISSYLNEFGIFKELKPDWRGKMNGGWIPKNGVRVGGGVAKEAERPKSRRCKPVWWIWRIQNKQVQANIQLVGTGKDELFFFVVVVDGQYHLVCQKFWIQWYFSLRT